MAGAGFPMSLFVCCLAFAGGTHAAMSAADHERERSRG
jgi:Na+/H+ antiporter NhaA